MSVRVLSLTTCAEDFWSAYIVFEEFDSLFDKVFCMCTLLVLVWDWIPKDDLSSCGLFGLLVVFEFVEL